MLRLIPPPLHRLLYRLADAARSIWWRVRKPALNGVAVVATDLQGQLLLIRLSYGPGGWNVPAGGVNRGEQPEAAARRELREETGCEAHSIKLLTVKQESLFGALNTLHVYSAKVSGQPVADLREVVEARFFPMHSLPEPLAETTKRRLELYRQTSQ